MAKEKAKCWSLKVAVAPMPLCKRVQQVLAKLYAQGYVLKSTFSGDHGSISTLIFLKGQ